MKKEFHSSLLFRVKERDEADSISTEKDECNIKFVDVLNESLSIYSTVPNWWNLRVARTFRQRLKSRWIIQIHQIFLLFGVRVS